jgi:hypothetical protein
MYIVNFYIHTHTHTSLQRALLQQQPPQPLTQDSPPALPWAQLLFEWEAAYSRPVKVLVGG